MTKPARRALRPMTGTVLVTVLAAACPMLSSAAVANTAGPYLNWQNKTPASAPVAVSSEIHTSSGNYPVPPSPYGQVGDPYAKSLSWPAKGASTAPAVASLSPPPQAPITQPPVYEAAPVAPVQTAPYSAATASISSPIPLPMPQAVPVVRVPAPVPSSHAPIQPEPAIVVPSDYRDDPGYADDPGLSDEDPAMASIAPVVAVPSPPPVVPLKPEPRPEPVVASAAPLAPAPAPVAPKPEPVAPPAVAAAVNSNGAYQVPSTSKYAARIEASRAAQQAEAPAPAPVAQAAAKPAPKPEAVATAPEPQVSLASQETDHVFIPGEQIRTPADEPRVYSLHRQYGLRPDPISVTPNATGGLLIVDAVEGGDPNDDTPADHSKLN